MALPNLPVFHKLLNNRERVPVLMSAPTRDIARIMLEDSARLQVKNARLLVESFADSTIAMPSGGTLEAKVIETP